MKILLSGSSGFTGKHFINAAQAAGHDVIPLRSNVLDADAVTREVSSVRPNYVVHLAAISYVGHDTDSTFYAVNTVGTTNLLDALCKSNCNYDQIILASSANVYGNCSRSPITENEVLIPVNHYGASKLSMELMGSTYSDRLPIVITRPFNYTGVGQGEKFLIPKLVSHFAQRSKKISLGTLQIRREFNDVRMVCDVYLSLLKSGVNGEIYNVCSGLAYSIEDVINILQKLTLHDIEVDVQQKFVRPNELYNLCGSNKKIVELGIVSNGYDLPATLEWMLEAAL